MNNPIWVWQIQEKAVAIIPFFVHCKPKSLQWPQGSTITEFKSLVSVYALQVNSNNEWQVIYCLETIQKILAHSSCHISARLCTSMVLQLQNTCVEDFLHQSCTSNAHDSKPLHSKNDQPSFWDQGMGACSSCTFVFEPDPRQMTFQMTPKVLWYSF